MEINNNWSRIFSRNMIQGNQSFVIEDRSMDLFNHRSILPLFKQQSDPSSSRHFLSFSTFLNKRDTYTAPRSSRWQKAPMEIIRSIDTHENAPRSLTPTISSSFSSFILTWYDTLRAFLFVQKQFHGIVNRDLNIDFVYRNVRYNLIGEGWPSFPSLRRDIFI